VFKIFKGFRNAQGRMLSGQTIRTPRSDQENASMGQGEAEKCHKCYTCEAGISPEITAVMFKKAKAEGSIPQEWFVNDGCTECVTCEKGFSSVSKRRSTTYFVFLTNECNLRCTYCYATKRPMIMTPDTIERLKVFLTDAEDIRLGPARDISIQFFGGEPTMEWDAMKKFIVEFEVLAAKRGMKVKWGMTTNCTLLTEERLQFMKDHDLKPLLSIDGRPETHDRHRLTVSGKGSSHLIDLDMILKYFPTPEIRPTITPESIHTWLDDLAWFHSKGLYTVATEVAYEADWKVEDFAAAEKVYAAMAEIYVNRKLAGLPIWMKFIEDGKGISTPQRTGSVCGTVNNSCAIDAAGRLFACQRYASFANDALILGDIYSGFNEIKLKEAQSLKRENMFPAVGNCDGCVARWMCRGGCNAMNHQVHGDRRKILENHCIFHQMWARLSLMALARTGELWAQKKHTCKNK